MSFHGLFEDEYTMAYTTDLLFTAERILTKGAAIELYVKHMSHHHVFGWSKDA